MRRLAALLGAAAVATVPVTPARADSPAVTVDPAEVSIGQRVQVGVTGFPAGRAVTVTLCGNEGRRGSVDCDLPGSVAFPISRFDDEHVTPFPIGVPPVPCPCVIRASNTPGDDVASTPVLIRNFATAPVVENETVPPLQLQVRVRRAPQNPLAWLRSFVGGPTSYDLEIVMRNRISTPVDGVRVRARAGRNATDQSRRMVVEPPKSLLGGQRWVHAQRVTLSAPVLGRFVWTVTASGDGALATSSVVTHHRPLGLYLLVTALLGDIGWILGRRVRRRRRPRPTKRAATAESLLTQPVRSA